MVIRWRIEEHLRNFNFLLITFTRGLFYFCFYLVGIITGFSLAFTLVGLPILHYVLRTTAKFVDQERTMVKVYADITMDPVKGRPLATGGLWEQVKAEVLDARNWKVIGLLMFKFVIGCMSLICTALFYFAPCLFLLTPVLYQVIPMTLLGVEINTLSKALLIMLGGAALFWIGSQLGRGLVKLIAGYTVRMAKTWSGQSKKYY